MKELQHTPDFNYHPRCQKLGIVNLCFASDLLMFARGDSVSISLLHEKFLKFSEATGLQENLNKSQLYFGGVSNEVKQQISHTWGMKKVPCQ